MNCPTCERIKYSNGRPVALAHPEETPWLCKVHLKELRHWHNEEVSKGNIQPWAELTLPPLMEKEQENRIRDRQEHRATEDYCCACEFDIAVMKGTISQALAEQREELMEEVGKLEVLWLSRKPDDSGAFNLAGINKSQVLNLLTPKDK